MSDDKDFINGMLNSREFKYQGLNHGGRVLAAAKKYQVEKDKWIDLSTGLNPNAWPIPNIPEEVWQSLPEEDDGLQTAACLYYGCEACLPVAGSQSVIQTLPALRIKSKVGVISPTYAEHEYNWKQAGHEVIQVTVSDVIQHIHELDVLVVINPNNPTGEIIEASQLLEWHEQLSKRGGWLIVDEAFMDTMPQNSLVQHGVKPGLIILRSIGKFFGLAGIRCGFVISDDLLLQQLSQRLGPWALTGPTRYIARQALLDKSWQQETRESLKASGARLYKMLQQSCLLSTAMQQHGGTDLFQWFVHPDAINIYESLAKKGILVRLFPQQEKISIPSLRFGLPKNEKQWDALNKTLNDLPVAMIASMEGRYD